jgi:cytochrome P450
VVGHVPMFLWDKLSFLDGCAEMDGPVSELRIGGHTVLLKEPADIRFVLEVRPEIFDKTPKLTSERGLQLSGRGLLTSSGMRHKYLRDALQPLFSRPALSAQVSTMAATTASFIENWRNRGRLDLREEMPSLARQIVSRILFGAGEANDTALASAFLVRKKYLQFRFDMPFSWPEWLPVPLEIRYQRAMKTIGQELTERIQREPEGACLVGQMRKAGLTAAEVYEEALTLAITGYETLGEALTWTLWLLAAHPTEQEKVREEARSALREEVPSAADMVELPFTSTVLMESLRLYPPTWLFLRTALEPATLPSGYTARAGTKIYLSPWVVHRDPRFYPEPAKFRPERFVAAEIANRPKLSYFPFGAGPRMCIGHHLAKIEATLVLALLLRDLKFQQGSRPDIKPSPRMVLQPSGPVWTDVSMAAA